jgi:hypothetical protein
MCSQPFLYWRHVFEAGARAVHSFGRATCLHLCCYDFLAWPVQEAFGEVNQEELNRMDEEIKQVCACVSFSSRDASTSCLDLLCVRSTVCSLFCSCRLVQLADSLKEQQVGNRDLSRPLPCPRCRRFSLGCVSLMLPFDTDKNSSTIASHVLLLAQVACSTLNGEIAAIAAEPTNAEVC